MAKVSGNILTTGLRGKIGQLMVFRMMGGKTYVSRAPRRPDKRKETVAQRKTRSTFREASRWAKIVLHDPEKKKYYQECAKAWELTNAYTAAIKDYMRNPQIALRRDESVREPLVTAPPPTRAEVMPCSYPAFRSIAEYKLPTQRPRPITTLPTQRLGSEIPAIPILDDQDCLK